MKIRFLTWGVVSLLATVPAAAQTSCDYVPSDSLCAVTLMRETAALPGGAPLLVRIGEGLIGTPYVGGVLDRGERETVRVNLREIDCTTYVETVLALTRAVSTGGQDFGSFVRELEHIRYRDGRAAGYPSRLHYTTEWFLNNDKKGTIALLRDLPGSACFTADLHFMSDHPDKYARLKDNEANLREIKAREDALNALKLPVSYLPADKADDPQVVAALPDQGIVAFITSAPGLDFGHMGIVYKENGRIQLMHASMSAGKVVRMPLTEYLKQSGVKGFKVVAVPGAVLGDSGKARETVAAVKD